MKKPVQISVPLPKTSELKSSPIHTEVALDHNTRTDTATTEAAHNNLIQHTEDTATDPVVTHCIGHIKDHPHIAVLWVIDPEI